METKNGGESWTTYEFDIDNTFVDLEIINDSTMFLTGGYGLILKTNLLTLNTSSEFERKNAPFILYPNPANNFISLKSQDLFNKNVSFSIFDFQGKKVQIGSLNFENGSQNIDIQNLKNGFYFLQIETEKGVWVEKFVKF